MLPDESTQEFDSAKFWAKIELPNGRTGFLPAEVFIDENDLVTFTCPRPNEGSFLRLFPPKPLPEGTLVSLAYQDNHFFELWSSEVSQFLGSKADGLDEYQVQAIKQEMSSSERKSERYTVQIPLKVKVNGRVVRFFHFSGCDLSTDGIGLWFPGSAKNRIRIDETYEIIFEPKEVEPFSLNAKVIRPHCEDTFSKGFVAGFQFEDLETDSLPALRIRQLIEARGKLRELEISESGHFLSGFWIGEFLGELSQVL